LFALFIIEKCFCLSLLLLASTSLSVFSFPPRHFVFVSFLSPPPQLYTRLISSCKHPHKYISILKLDTQKVISLRLLLVLSVLFAIATRYLNFILMFVPSINFYNPFINLIKTKQPRIVFGPERSIFVVLSEFSDQLEEFRRRFRNSLALEFLAAHRAEVGRGGVGGLAVGFGDVATEIRFAGEGHGAAGDGAFEDPLVGVLS
jgi:hypothetical protein